MRAYNAASEEALLARDLLKDWKSEGFLTEAQYQRMEQDAACDLRRTNIFLRVVLFLFTLLIVGAAAALFFTLFIPHAAAQTTGIVLLIFAGVLYAAAEYAVSEGHLYRYGIEEALAVCSAGFLCAGMYSAMFSGPPYGPKPGEFLVPAAGAVASLWIWYRFGMFYAFAAAMVFVVWLPGHWTASHSAQHTLVALFYTAGLGVVAAQRSRYRLTYLNERYSVAEAFLWLGIYLAINLRLSSVNPLGHWWAVLRTTSDFSRSFYWATWLLIWCLPAAMLWRGVRGKDRFVIAAGAITAILTLATNKAYLGWERHTWDPMLLGVLLFAVAVFLRRWLAQGPGGIRSGFTARRLSGKDKDWMDTGSSAFGVVLPYRPPGESEVRFGGGESGGGGASSDF